ncbi:MAG TPA: hypothetical protein VMS38_12385 [Pseudorhodoferax sp.]|nr:hypothetical protein [Pseudorhodoferax sp.]
MKADAMEQAMADPHPVAPVASRRRLRWAVWGAWLAFGALIAMVAAAVMAILLQQPVKDLESVVEQVRRWKYVGVLVQALVALAIVLRWSAIAAWAARKGVIKAHEVETVIAARWKVVALLVVYLLVTIGPGEITRLVSLFA